MYCRFHPKKSMLMMADMIHGKILALARRADDLRESVRWRVTDRFRHYRARLWRVWLHDVTFIAVTGSAGKTTSKDLATQVLSKHGSCHSNRDTKNTFEQVDQTVLSTKRNHAFSVVEMSASSPGYLDRPIRTVRPDVAVLTVVASEHYAAFRNLEAVAAEKGKLIESLSPGGIAVLNRDDPWIRAIGEKRSGKTIWIGRDEKATIRLIEARSRWPEPLTLTVDHEGRRHQIVTGMHGTHLAIPVLCAVGVCVAVGVAMDDIVADLRDARNGAGRMQVEVLDDGVAFIRDDFKAPEWSLAAPLQFLKEARAERKIAVIGAISDSPAAPAKRYARAARAALEAADIVLLVGAHTLSSDRANRIRDDGSLRIFATLKEANSFLKDEVRLRRGDLVLLKGGNPIDHLVRILHDHRRPIRCWSTTCRKFMFCDTCPELYGSADVNRRRTAAESDAAAIVDESAASAAADSPPAAAGVPAKPVAGAIGAALALGDRASELMKSLRWLRKDRPRHYRAVVHRRLLPNVLFIGVTGSAGKTSTKDFVTHLLSSRGPCSSNVRSRNEHGGIDEIILATTRGHRYCVAEIATTKPGYIDRSIRTVRPKIGALTVIASEHYAAFRTLEAIAAEKRKLIDALPPDGIAVLNRDDPFVRAIGESHRGRIIWVGRDEDATLRLVEARSNWPEPLTLVVEYEGERHDLTTRLHGVQQTTPLLCALGIGLAAGIPIAEAIAALASAPQTEGRMQIEAHADGVTFIRDDYKAPQWSLQAPLDFLHDARAPRKIVVFGTISDTPTEASRRYAKAARAGLAVADLVLLVGPHTISTDRARRICDDGSLRVYTSIREAAIFLKNELRPGDLVLLKGTNKVDHLARIPLHRQNPVQCWDMSCRRLMFCDECPKLRSAPSCDDEEPAPVPYDDQAAMNDDGRQASTVGVAIIVGLGNPGESYRHTVHNVGQLALDRLAARAAGSWISTPAGLETQIELDGVRTVLVKLDLPMNHSGSGVKTYLHEHRRDAGDVIVLYDDVDLPVGSARIKRNGGDAGHRGMRSILEALSTDVIARVRIGVRDAQQGGQAREFVLARIDASEGSPLCASLDKAVELVDTLIRERKKSADGATRTAPAPRTA